MTIRCVLYPRISSKRQQEGASLEEQERDLRAYAAARGWEIVAVYQETASTWHGTRDEFERMVEDARQGKFDRILVWKLDRFARRSGQLHVVTEELERHGVYLVLVKEGIDLSEGGIAAKAIKAALALSADLENEARADRSRMANEHRKGLRLLPWKLPTGYRSGGKYKPAVVVEEEAAGVRRAYQLYATDQFSVVELCSKLNDEGYRIKSRQGRFNYRALHHILTNREYTGRVLVDGQWLPGVAPAIVDDELFDRVQAVLAAHAQAPRSVSRKMRPYLLKGLVYCTACRRKMYAQYCGGKHRIVYYKDTSYFSNEPCPADETVGNRLVVETVLALQIEIIIRSFSMLPPWRERVLDILASRDERRAMEASRQAKQTQLERLKAIYVEGDMEMAEYRRQRDKLRDELKTLVVPQEAQVLDAGQFLQNMAGTWEIASTEERHDLLRAIFSKIWVDRTTQRITGVEVYPEYVPAFLQVPGLERAGEMFRIGGQVIGGFEVGESVELAK